MSNVVPEEIFQKKLKRKEFESLYYSFIFRDPCLFDVSSIIKICSEHKIKVVEYLCGVLGYTDHIMVDDIYFIESAQFMEWDYEFIKADVLRVSMSSSLWYDIYFPENLTEEKQEEYEELLERSVLVNYSVSDNYSISRKMMLDRLADMQDEYFRLYGEDLTPSFFNS